MNKNGKAYTILKVIVTVLSLTIISCTKGPNVNYTDTSDLPESLQFVARQAATGNGVLQFEIGMAYVEGEVVQKSADKALVWLEAAAQHNVNAALYNLGVLNVELKNYEKAAYWYEQAANNGDSGAFISLANLYSFDEISDPGYKMALHWTSKAAEAGDPLGQYNLAVMYHKGKGVLIDPVKEVFWLERAARSGVVDAMYIFGSYYLEGTKVEKDKVKAYVWIKLSLDRAGAGSNQDVLNKHEKELKQLRKTLTQKEIAEAEEQIARYPNNFQ